MVVVIGMPPEVELITIGEVTTVFGHPPLQDV